MGLGWTRRWRWGVRWSHRWRQVTRMEVEDDKSNCWLQAQLHHETFSSILNEHCVTCITLSANIDAQMILYEKQRKVVFFKKVDQNKRPSACVVAPEFGMKRHAHLRACDTISSIRRWIMQSIWQWIQAKWVAWSSRRIFNSTSIDYRQHIESDREAQKLNHTSSINQCMFDTFTSEHVPMQRSKNMIVNVTCVNEQDDWKSKKLWEIWANGELLMAHYERGWQLPWHFLSEKSYPRTPKPEHEVTPHSSTRIFASHRYFFFVLNFSWNSHSLFSSNVSKQLWDLFSISNRISSRPASKWQHVNLELLEALAHGWKLSTRMQYKPLRMN